MIHLINSNTYNITNNITQVRRKASGGVGTAELTLEDGASTYINGICIYTYIHVYIYIYIYIYNVGIYMQFIILNYI